MIIIIYLATMLFDSHLWSQIKDDEEMYFEIGI